MRVVEQVWLHLRLGLGERRSSVGEAQGEIEVACVVALGRHHIEDGSSVHQVRSAEEQRVA